MQILLKVFIDNQKEVHRCEKHQQDGWIYCFARMAARLLVTAWKPVLIDWTEHLEWQVMHCRKKRRSSLFKMVSGDLQVWQVTYSLIYLLSTFSMCFCWNLPFMTSWLLPSTEPTVPNSADKKASKCLGWRWSLEDKSFVLQCWLSSIYLRKAT